MESEAQENKSKEDNNGVSISAEFNSLTELISKGKEEQMFENQMNLQDSLCVHELSEKIDSQQEGESVMPSGQQKEEKKSVS